MSSTWLQLGRTGDVLSILPLLYKDAMAGKRWSLMVAAEYASVLEGVSYVDPVVFDGAHHEISKAYAQALATGGQVVSSQVNGPQDQVRQCTYGPAGQEGAKTTSFVKEMWKVTGRLKEYEENLPLVFDRRNPERESQLLASLDFRKGGRQKRLMLVSLQGNSSPFPHAELLLELLKGRFGQTHRILELPKAERIYDLLALYEKAELLVATDSAPLHLAQSVPSLPVVAFANDKPMLWNGSPWRPNHAFYCRYSDFVPRAVEMLEAIEDAIRLNLNKPIGPQVVHLWNAYENTGLKSPWIPFPIRVGMCGKDSSMVENDPVRVPYLKECLKMALQKGSEYVCVTHPESQVHDPRSVIQHEVCYAYRILRDGDDEGFQPTVDLFCARSQWWRQHFAEIPDYFLGRDYWWTHGLRGLFSRYGAVDVTGAVTKNKSVSSQSPQKPPLPPRIKRNKDLAEAYIKEAGVYSRYPKVVDQIEVAASFSGTLRNAYNPAIVEHKGQILMAVRWHPYPTPSTSLMLVELNQDLTIKSSQPIEFFGNTISSEDPKWFVHNGELHMSWVDATWPTQGKPQAVVRYCRYQHETFQDFQRPELPGNDGSTTQKNYVLWQHGESLFCQYSCQPYHVYNLENNLRLESNEPKWAYGAIRGGTAPVEYEGALLRFFHGHLDNEFGKWSRRYYMGAMLIEKEPPFKVIRVSKKPILFGSEICELKVKDRPHHFKANVVFVNGVIVRNGYWLCSVGINDSASVIVKIYPKDLNL